MYGLRMFARTAALMAASMAMCVPVAHADARDDKYLAALASQGITGDPAQLIADGQAACDNYGTAGLVGQMMGLEGRGLSNVQASNLLVTGVRAYCPEKSPLGPLS